MPVVALVIQRDVWFLGTSDKLYELSHKNLGALAILPVCGAENTPCIKGSRNEQPWELVMSPLLCMQHWFGGIFSFQDGVIAVEMQFEKLFS